ncbi:hypothetical protein Ancab_012263 [Ancistrocladus abbreviatus]
MAVSPQTHQQDYIPLDFRAPPPSPIAASRRSSSVANDAVLTDFLEHTLRVPDLILPDRIFPKQKPIHDVPKIDFRSLGSREDDSVSKLVHSFAEIGCFQLINHGISPELIGLAMTGAAGIFRVSPEMKATVLRSSEMPYGFDEVHGEDEEMGEEFVWSREYGFKLKMEGILPTEYSNFSVKMETLASAVEKVGRNILSILQQDHSPESDGGGTVTRGRRFEGSIGYIYKHPRDLAVDQCISSLRYDVIRMMIKGSDYSHALSLHLCDGSSEFHIYSKKGWVSFTPDEKALIVTAGDELQAWCGGQYNKHVIGRPIYTGKREDCISMAFLYSPPPSPAINSSSQALPLKKKKIISLSHQALFAVFLTLTYQLLLYLCK